MSKLNIVGRSSPTREKEKRREEGDKGEKKSKKEIM
jgi:hypothetical protein